MDKISIQKAFYLNLDASDWNLNEPSHGCWTGIFSRDRIAMILNGAVERHVNTNPRRSLPEVKKEILITSRCYADFGALNPECISVLDRVLNYIYSQEDDWK
jgi:hypothetical protein